MSDYAEHWKRIRQVATETAVEVAWDQWVALGSLARPASRPIERRIVDPEALILLSLAFREDERRLVDMLRWWAQAGVPLTSLQRLRTLVEELPEQTTDDFALFARWASDAGHRNWSRYAAPADAQSSLSRASKGPEELKLIEPSTLMLRLRAAFGVGAKSDVLAFLIGRRGGMATVSVISRAIGYTETAVRGALKDMALARLIHETTNRPAYYMAPHRAWVDLLELEIPAVEDGRSGPSWGMWLPIFDLLISARALAEGVLHGDENEYVTSSIARDVFERSDHALNFHEIAVPSPERYEGREFAIGFRKTLEAVGEWAHGGIRV